MTNLNSFLNLVDVAKSIPKEMAETFVTTPLCELNTSLNKLLKGNQIIAADQVEEQTRVAKVITRMSSIQTEMLKKGRNQEIKGMLLQMQEDIKATIGGTMTDETSNVIGQMCSNFESLDSSLV